MRITKGKIKKEEKVGIVTSYNKNWITYTEQEIMIKLFIYSGFIYGGERIVVYSFVSILIVSKRLGTEVKRTQGDESWWLVVNNHGVPPSH